MLLEFIPWLAVGDNFELILVLVLTHGYRFTPGFSSRLHRHHDHDAVNDGAVEPIAETLDVV